MGIRKRVYYTVECNSCKKLLEDDVGELTGITLKRKDAEKIATDNGWENNGKDLWICSDCKEKRR